MKFNLFLTVSIIAIINYGCGSETTEKIIPGLQPVDVQGIFEKKGFSISIDSTSQPATWWCTKKEGFDEYRVTIYSKSSTEISFISCQVNSTPPEIDRASQEFLSDCATIPYEGSNPQAAKSWAVSHIKSGGDTVINKVKLKIYVNPKPFRSIEITPNE